MLNRVKREHTATHTHTHGKKRSAVYSMKKKRSVYKNTKDAPHREEHQRNITMKEMCRVPPGRVWSVRSDEERGGRERVST